MNAKFWTALGLTAALLATTTAASAAVTTAVATKTTIAAQGETITWAGYGDSNMKRPDSWVSQFDAAGFTRTGGYFENGYTSAQVLAAMPAPTVAPDLAVIGLGTNDVKFGVTPADVCANVKKIATKSAAARTLILAIPPNDYTDDETTHVDRRTKGIILNRDMSICAMTAGYMFADPWAFQRAWWGGWGGGADVDGTHPTTLVAGQVSDRMPIYMRQALYGATH